MRPEELKEYSVRKMQDEVAAKQLEATQLQLDTNNQLLNTIKELNRAVLGLSNRNYNQLQQFSNQLKFMVNNQLLIFPSWTFF